MHANVSTLPTLDSTESHLTVHGRASSHCPGWWLQPHVTCTAATRGARTATDIPTERDASGRTRGGGGFAGCEGRNNEAQQSRHYKLNWRVSDVGSRHRDLARSQHASHMRTCLTRAHRRATAGASEAAWRGPSVPSDAAPPRCSPAATPVSVWPPLRPPSPRPPRPRLSAMHEIVVKSGCANS